MKIRISTAFAGGMAIAALSVAVPASAQNDDFGMPMHPGFERMDKNGDGEIDREEVAAQQREHFGRLDLDGDGSVTAAEMREAIEQMRRERLERRAQRRLERLDADGDGTISEDEFIAMHERMFERFDADGDGAISVDELPHRGGGMRGHRHHGKRMGDDSDGGR